MAVVDLTIELGIRNRSIAAMTESSSMAWRCL
jgi:hypothetical protein